MRNFSRFAAVIAATAFLGGNLAYAASHREAPLIALDPAADITDVYAFVSYDHENRSRPAEDQ